MMKMNSKNHTSKEEETIAKKLELQELRMQNASRWTRLKTLHVQRARGEEGLSVSEAMQREMMHQGGPELLPTATKSSYRAFGREVVKSYDELVQARALLRQRLHHEQQRLDVSRQVLRQTKEYCASLEASLIASENVASESDPGGLLQEEGLELKLKDDLSDVAALLDAESQQTANDRHLWSLGKLLCELIDRYHDSPADPYVLASTLPIHPRHVELLQQCHVIQRHEYNEHLICLSDYLGVLSTD
jgi:hypothetical protein